MSSVPEDKRYAPPTAHVDDLTPQGQFELAGRGGRFGAAFIDGLLILAAFWIIAAASGLSFRTAARGGYSTTLALQAGVFVAFVVVQGYLLATRGQTVGKMLLGIRIVRSDGERASFGRLVGLRYGVGFLINAIPFIGGLYGLVDSLLIFRESRQCLHDNIADTIVVRA
ncbi:MAG TPA: RDD family protein [Albitalea sp.]|nr:RDD family protein [Albitalea sp.]